MVKRCDTLNQEGSEACPGVEVLLQASELHFSQMRQELKETVSDAFKVQLEQATGFAWEERKVLKCILGWAKKTKDEDNRLKIWVWAVGASVASGSIVWFMRGLTP